jgi:hypothetical protein
MTYTLAQYTAVLDARHEAYELLPLNDNGAIALITQKTARVLGLFEHANAPNLFWTNPVTIDVGAYEAFVQSGQWNLGGNRLWIAPEIQFNVRNRADFWGTIQFPPQMDPGNYALICENKQVTLWQQCQLEAHNLASGQIDLSIQRTLRPVPNPLRTLKNAPRLTYFGYEHVVKLNIDATTSPDIQAEAWDLVQLNPGGQLLILSTSQVEASDYFGTVPPQAHIAHGNHVRLSITGTQEFKVGYKSACMLGRMAYWNTLSDGREYLLIRQFFNNPSAVYSEEPPAMVGNHGHSVHIYNGGGDFGAMGEMEVNGQTIGGASGLTSNTDHFVLWGFIGNHADIQQVSDSLLGVVL